MSDNKRKQRKIKTLRAKKISQSYLHNAGLYYLQCFAASETQFRRVLERKVEKSCAVHQEQNYDSCLQMVDELIVQFRASGLLNDELYAEAKIKSLIRRGFSRARIENTLLAKGLESTMVCALLGNLIEDSSDYNFYAALVFARKKKLGPFANPVQPATQTTLAKFARAGFSYAHAQAVLQLDPEEALQKLDSKHPLG